MEALNICYVESGYPHPHGGGGAGTYVQLVGQELVRQGHRVTVVASHCPKCPSSAWDSGVAVYRPKLMGTRHWYLSKLPGLRVGALALRSLEQGWQLALFLERLHRQNPIDLVEFTEGGDFWHAFKLTFPYLVHLHGSRYTCLHMAGQLVGRADWYHRYLELMFIRRAQWVVSPSQSLLDIVSVELGHPLKQCTVIPYPLDLCLQQLNLSQSQQENSAEKVFFAARNDPIKGAEILLQALPLVRQKIPNVEFQFFGHSLETPPPGVYSSGFLPKEILLKHYQQSDLCIVPSLWDNSPNVVYEAMACGKAVVASNVGGIPELVVDGETGIIVPPGDSRALADAIITLLMDDEKRIDMGRRGRERIQHLTDLQKNIKQRCKIYQKVLTTG